MGVRFTKNRNNFKALIAAAPKAARFLEEKHIDIWMQIMIPLMPEDTGAMKRSVEKVRTAAGHFGLMIGEFYWIYQNYGTVYIVGLFFLQEAQERTRGGFVKDVKSFIKYVRQFA